MSGLEKFEPTDAWKNKIKKLLFVERKTVLKATGTNKIKEADRFSLDIDTDLQKLIEEKKSAHLKKKMELFQSDDKENICFNGEKNFGISKIQKGNRVQFNTDDTILEGQMCGSKNQVESDESFEAMERMCNKTASDPNSTLFQYIHSDNKREVIDATKKRYSGADFSKYSVEDSESAALDRLLHNLHFQDHSQIANESILKGIEETQIEDIEAPSRLWENTASYESMLQTSPVKMVGLMRPSTILECADESDASSSQTSYQSAMKGQPSEISSSCYETASDSLMNSKASKAVENEIELESSKIVDLTQEDESLQLIDFENTIGPKELLNLQEKEVEYEKESDDSIIEILSDDEGESLTDGEKFVFIKSEVPGTSFSSQCTENLISFATPLRKEMRLNSEDPLSIERASGTAVESFCSNRKTESPLCLEGPYSESKESSINFNDTLEEVEYMMKKGMEMMTPRKSPSKAEKVPTPNILKEKQNTFVLSPVKDSIHTPYKSAKETNRASPKIAQSSVYNFATKSTSKPVNRFVLDIKPIPKLDIFRKPTSTSKLVNHRHKDPFAHVVSPIGMYVKKTATTPMMTNMKTHNDALNSTAFREMENDSRKYNPLFRDPHNLGVTPLPKSPIARSLPKKAYISSHLRQVVDERSPVTIPGGVTIQRYLDSALLPAVIRHEGKTKLLGNNSTKLPTKMQKTSTVNSPTLRQNTKDSSLANLSVMSGDVSVYTIKDAQKL